MRAVGNPRPVLGGNPELAVILRQWLKRRIAPESRGKLLVIQRKGGLDHAGDARRGLAVAYLPLDAAKSADVPLPSLKLGEDRHQGGQLYPVPDLRAGAVGLDEIHRVGVDSGREIGPSYGLCLTLRLGRKNSGAPAVASGSYSLYDGVDAIAVPPGVLQPLEHQYSDALPYAGSVPVGREWLGMPLRGHGRGLAEAHEHEYVVEGVHASGEHHVGPARHKLHVGHVYGPEGACACGVYDAVGAAQIKEVRYSAGRHVAQQPRERKLLPLGVTGRYSP